MNTLRFYLLEAVTEYDEKHRKAQYNASLPIESGGLGLHKDNTSLDRATALGFDTNIKMLHGSDTDFDNTNDGMYTTTRPEYGYITKSKINYPVYIKRNNPLVVDNISKIESARSFRDDISNELSNGGHDTLEYRKPHDLYKGASGWGNDYPQYYSNKNTNVRSIHAAFDPMLKHTSNLLD